MNCSVFLDNIEFQLHRQRTQPAALHERLHWESPDEERAGEGEDWRLPQVQGPHDGGAEHGVSQRVGQVQSHSRRRASNNLVRVKISFMLCDNSYTIYTSIIMMF